MPPGTEDSPISDHSFQVFQPGSSEFEDSPQVTEKPVVKFQPDENTIVIRGKFHVGSSECDIAELSTLRYDSSSDMLYARIGVGAHSSGGNSCGSNESPDAYHLTVVFGDALPERVRVEESGDPTAQSTTANRS